MRTSFTVLLFIIPILVSAQEYLGDDFPFFQKKAKLYQRWLEAKNIDNILEVNFVRLEKEGTELELFLNTRTTNPDVAASLWEALEKSFTLENKNESLYEALFNTFTRMMEIPPAQGNVQIYVPKEEGYDYSPCFQIWIWEENGQIDIDRKLRSCKDQPLKMEIKLPKPVQKVNNEATVHVAGPKKGAEIFSQVLAYAKDRYEQTICENRDPKVQLIEQDDYMLTFVVTDLCRVVLTDEKESIWCQVVSKWWGPCNDMRRERLEFTIHYHPTENGYRLLGSLTGKFGSGVYRPRESGWMDMEPDFEEDFLVPYVRAFQWELKVYLEGR